MGRSVSTIRSSTAQRVCHSRSPGGFASAWGLAAPPAFVRTGAGCGMLGGWGHPNRVVAGSGFSLRTSVGWEGGAWWQRRFGLVAPASLPAVFFARQGKCKEPAGCPSMLRASRCYQDLRQIGFAVFSPSSFLITTGITGCSHAARGSLTCLFPAC
jgi:hypothetical protein